MLRTQLFPDQEEAVRRWASRPSAGFALFMEQRTGKTLTALAVVDRVQPRVLLVLTVVVGLKEWQRQIPEHLEIDWPCQVEILTYGKAANKKRRARLKRLLQRDPNSMVIADESHRIKRRGSKWSRSARVLAQAAKHRLALTGTPLGQNIHDAWAQFDFIDRDIFGRWSEFQDRFCVMGGYRGKKVVGHRNLNEFNTILHANSYRVTLREAQKARHGRTYRILRRQIPVTLGAEELQAYQDLERDLVTYVNGREVETPLVINKVMKLQQITGGFILHEGEAIRVGRSKEWALCQLLQSLPQEPTVICYRFVHEAVMLRQLADQLQLTVQSIADYTPDRPPDLILVQVQAGVAIDLSKSSRVIFYSWDYSYLNYEQLRFRVLSFNTQRVTYYYLVVKETIDEDLLEAVARKRNLATLVCDRFRRSMPR